MIQYRTIQENELDRELFSCFIRLQIVKNCLRREKGSWIVREDPFIDDWTEEDYQTLITCLANTIQTGGFVYGAFDEGRLKGFVSVESAFWGRDQQYLDLTSLHVSQDMRRTGIGRTLFLAAKEWAGKKGAEKLYISAHSAMETQEFYRAMGCVEAEEYNQMHVDAEPFDCQMECTVS